MTKANNRYLAALMAAAVALSCLAFAGCSSGASASASSASSSSTQSQSSSESSMLTLGDQRDTALNIVFTNGMASDITNLALMPAAETSQPDFLMEDGQVVAPDEQVSVYVEPTADARYNAVFVCDGVQHTLHNLDLALIGEATIRLEGDVAYIEALVAGSLVSSLQDEYDLANPPAPEEPAVEEPVVTYEEPVVTYEQPTTSYDSSANAAPAQSEDACVTDIVLR